jgi:hypothetical protein
MIDRLVERCAIDFERYIAELHSKVSAERSGIATCSIHIAPYRMDYRASDIPMLIREARTAYEARARFALDGPAWAQPLPLGTECNAFFRARGAMHLLGLYALSLELTGFDYQGHPKFHEFGCGVMANEAAPAHVRDDPELREEFPAKPLPGLGGRLIWFCPSALPPERRRRMTAV